MFFYRIASLLIILLISCCKVNAQSSVEGLNFLQQTFASAIQNSPELVAERSRLGISQAEILTAGVIENPYFVFVTEPRKEGYRFLLQKSFISPAVKKYEKLISQTEHGIELVQYKAAHLEVQDKIRQSYANLYANKQKYDLYNEIFCIITNILNETQDKKLSKKDILNVELFRAKIRNELEIISDSYTNAKLDFQELIGQSLPENISIESPASLLRTFEVFNVTDKSNIKEIMPETLVSYALLNNPEILENQQQLQLAKYEKDLAKANIFPLVTLAAGVDLDLQSGGTQTPRINANIELPVLDREQGEIQKATIQINHYQMSEEALKNQITSQIHAIYKKIIRYQESINRYENQHLPTINQLVQSSKSAFIESETDMSSVTNALQTYINIKLGYFESIENFQNSVGVLEKLLGLMCK